jgi:hypothetical protein
VSPWAWTTLTVVTLATWMRPLLALNPPGLGDGGETGAEDG